jgi:hypothetical protein
MVVTPAVPPAVTTPELLIDAVPGALLVHTPPPVALLSELVPPIHALSVPVIAAGTGFTFTVTPLVREQPLAVAVTLYTLAPVAVGVIVGFAHDEQDSPVAPDMPVQAKVGDGVPVNLILSTAQYQPQVEL